MASPLDKIKTNMKKMKIPFSKAKKILRGFKGADKMRRWYRDAPTAQSSTQIHKPSPPASPTPPPSPTPPASDKSMTIYLANDMSNWNVGGHRRISTKDEGIRVEFEGGRWASAGGINLKFKPRGFESSSSVTLEYDLFIPSDFDWVKGGKIGLGVNIGQGTGGKDWERDDASYRLMWRRGGQLIGYLYLPENMGKYEPENLTCPLLKSQPSEFIEAIGRRAPKAGLDVFRFTKQKLWLKRGKWNTIRMHAKLNDVGKTNGELELALNGEKLSTSLRWTGSAKDRFDQLQMPCWFGGGDKSYAPRKDQNIMIRGVRVTLNGK